MESLGFIDPPAASWTSRPSAYVPADPSEESLQTTELFEIPVGRHTRHVEPTGELISDIWHSTELHAPSLIDWAPHQISSNKLGTRFRWSVVVPAVIAAVVLTAIGYWALGRSNGTVAAALADVKIEATELAASLDRAGPLIAELDAERLPDSISGGTAFFEIGETARSLFAASADLPASDSAHRTAAAEAAGLAIDAARQLTDAVAYRAALEPALTLPLLETDSSLTDLVAATDAFTEWRAGFENVQSALSDKAVGLAATTVFELGAGLDTTQGAYLDAIRTGDRAAAVEAIGRLRAQLQMVRNALLDDMAQTATATSALIEQTGETLALLLG